MTHDIFFFLIFSIFGIGATICTRQEIQCLPHVGFLIFEQFSIIGTTFGRMTLSHWHGLIGVNFIILTTNVQYCSSVLSFLTRTMSCKPQHFPPHQTVRSSLHLLFVYLYTQESLTFHIQANIGHQMQKLRQKTNLQ